MFNKSDESWHPYIVLNLKENTFSFSLLNIMLAVDMSCLYIEAFSLNTHFVERFQS